mgnify:CR=1 FL=1
MNTTPAIKAAAVQMLPDLFDATRILSDEPASHLVDHGFHAQGTTFQCGFTPTGMILIRMNPHQQPARAYMDGFEMRYLHGIRTLAAIAGVLNSSGIAIGLIIY